MKNLNDNNRVKYGSVFIDSLSELEIVKLWMVINDKTKEDLIKEVNQTKHTIAQRKRIDDLIKQLN